MQSEVVSLDVHVVNENEAPGITSNASVVHVREDATRGTVLFDVTAVDPDAQDTLHFVVGDGSGDDSAELFAITRTDTTNGGSAVATATVHLSSDDLDYEKRADYEVYVCAVDRGGLSTCTYVQLHVVDVNDITIDSFAGSLTHATQGGDVVQLLGSNFGPTDGSLTAASIVATYGHGSLHYTATQCAVVGGGNTMIECTTVPGTGGDLAWTLNLAIAQRGLGLPPVVQQAKTKDGLTTR